MTIHQAYQQLLLQLYDLYDNREAANIADLVIENITGQRKIDRILYKDLPLSASQQEQLSGITSKLLDHVPLQYSIQEAWFAGMKFYVDENVLIPRPETEELVEAVVEEVKSKKSKVKTVIDIGTGSGCIPITLKKKMPFIEVTSVDISDAALAVAKRNAQELEAEVLFRQQDFLTEEKWNDLGSFDIIVSNPPYIKRSEATTMNRNVLDHEPHLALFVPEEDSLLFYRKIALFGKKHLNEGGMIFMEINESLGEAVSALFIAEGYSAHLQKDMQGKDRIVRAEKG